MSLNILFKSGTKKDSVKYATYSNDDGMYAKNHTVTKTYIMIFQDFILIINIYCSKKTCVKMLCNS